MKNGVVEIYPDFRITRSKDLMIRGKTFQAIWDADAQLWSTDEYQVQRLVDKELLEYRDKLGGSIDGVVQVKLMSDFSSNSWTQFRTYISNLSDNSHELDSSLTFSDTEVLKKDYVSKRLPYPLEAGSYNAYDEIIGTLYEPDERRKLEWAIGAIISGDAKDIQKFIVLYGEAGGGKSTILNIVQKLFVGYYTTFDSKVLTSANNAFSTEAFKGNPLVAIQHDGDLSRIEDNSKLNSIVSHEMMTMNEKYKPTHTDKVNCFLFIGTNKPVKITDGKSGIIRRLIDVRTSGNKIPNKRYQLLMSQIDFELGAIAYHCLETYRSMGKNYYSGYKPVDMMLQTDVFYNFVEANYYAFRSEDGVTLAQAYAIYKAYCEDSMIEYKLPRHKFREELKNYFTTFSDMARVDGKQVRSLYTGFIVDKFISTSSNIDEEPPNALVLDQEISLLDDVLKACPAQYAVNDQPSKKWVNVRTHLEDINTKLLHYVVIPENEIVIDFDIRDASGEKSLELNMDAASKLPPTYAELSKSGKGVHLHYYYDGDISQLSRIYAEGVEIKISTVGPVGPTALRRKLTKCNNIPIAHINSGLPLKGEKTGMIDHQTVKSERGLRELITRNLNKEIHPGTKPSIDFIYKILEDAYTSGMKYDLTSMRPSVLSFAVNSTNHGDYCINLVSKMHFMSDEVLPEVIDGTKASKPDLLVFYDVEVFPNLFIVNWMYDLDDAQVVRMINPSPKDIEQLMQMPLVGFNCRRYDNHILYGRYSGYSLEQLYALSTRIIEGSMNAFFREAYNISYTDIYDFTSKKQSLKLYQLELGLKHMELGLPWNEPVPEELWHKVAEYCDNDVISTRATFHSRKQDYNARLILAELSGLTPNDTTQMHTAKILFGTDPKPQEHFEYTDLSTMFHGYRYANGESTYRNEIVGEGGYVYSEPGIYTDVALLDVASMHPSSIINMNAFGKYTPRYKELLEARLAIKHKDYDAARKMLGGMLSPYLENEDDADALAYALKIHALNIVYGLTAAKFDNKFRDPRNIDNIVAKRGALFMVDLKYAVQKEGYQVVHIKTDSIKIANADKTIIDFVFSFGQSYGYQFEHEATYDRLALVNDAVYIARYKDGKKAGKWTPTGAEFAHPYVFKTLFSKEKIEPEDLSETKSVTTALYLDMNEDLPDVSMYEKELAERLKVVDSQQQYVRKLNKKLEGMTDLELEAEIQKGHHYQFIGKAGSFIPVKKGTGGGVLLRYKDGKFYAATGTKGYRWLETEAVKTLDLYAKIDKSYHDSLVNSAVNHISQFGDFDTFVSD